MPASRSSSRCWRPPTRNGTRVHGGEPHRAVPATKAAAPLMARLGGGAIVNITSISSLRASTLRSAYGTQQGGAGASHQAVRGRTRRRSASASTRWRPARSTPRWPRRVHHAGDPRRLSRRHSAQPLRPGRRNWPRRSSSCAATAPATSPARSSRSMAASMPPASACRRCGGRRAARIASTKRHLSAETARVGDFARARTMSVQQLRRPPAPASA